MYIHDQHIHTSYSRDSQADIYEYAKKANELGCKYFVTTDHIEFNSVATNDDWTVDYENLMNDLRKLKKIYPHMEFLLGIEIGYRKDKLKEMNELLSKYPFDLVNMSIHDNGKVDYYMKKDFREIGIDKMLNIYFNNIIDGLKTYDNFNVLSHFDYGFKTAYLIDNNTKLYDYEHYIKEIFKLVIEKEKTLELNIKVQENINNDIFLKYWLKLYKQMGGYKLSLSSDSHNNKDYLLNHQHYINIIKEAGFTELRYFVKRKEYIYEL